MRNPLAFINNGRMIAWLDDISVLHIIDRNKVEHAIPVAWDDWQRILEALHRPISVGEGDTGLPRELLPTGSRDAVE